MGISNGQYYWDGWGRLYGPNDNPLTDDTFLMGDGNDFAYGNNGADGYFGGADLDTVSYRFALEAVIVNLDFGGTGGMADGDSYNSIERIFGSNFNDSITGDGGDNFLYGGLGNDFINGGGGSDRIFGGEGDDEFYGGGGNNRIFLGDGEDYSQGGEGNDFFYLTNDGDVDEVYGGNDTNGDGPNTDNGYDTVSYAQATGGVEVYLGGFIPFRPPLPDTALPSDEPLNMPVLEEDFLTGIERVIGSNFDDAIFGSFADEVIIGGNGDDLLSGGSGRDRLIGGNGSDTFQFNIGFDDTVSIVDFTQGVDTIIFFTSDEDLTEADILATMVDYGNGVFVFELGLIPDGPPVEQRLAVITGDSEIIPDLDDFTIELIDDLPPGPIPLQEPYDEGAFTVADIAAFADFDSLV